MLTNNRGETEMEDQVLQGYIISGLNEIKRLAQINDTENIINEVDDLLNEIRR